MLQSKQVKRSSYEWINNFIIANLLSGITSVIWLLDMGVFCGQNFEREYIDVLLNKLLLCVIIQIRK